MKPTPPKVMARAWIHHPGGRALSEAREVCVSDAADQSNGLDRQANKSFFCRELGGAHEMIAGSASHS